MMWIMNANPDVSEIETERDEIDLGKLHRHAGILIRDVFSGMEMAAIRRSVEAAIRRSYDDGCYALTDHKYPGQSIVGDLLGMEELSDLDYIAFDPRVVRYAKQILGNDIVYFGDSMVRIGNGGRGFHKDFFDESDPTPGDVRFALYLQDHSRHSGGLKIRLGSHRHVSRHRGTMMNVPSRTGDLVVFYLRSSHTGNNVRLKGLPELCLHPKLENHLPRALIAPEERERICVLWTFGVRSPHLDRYIKWITRNPEHFRRSGYNPKILELADRRGVDMLKVVPDQGSLLPQ